MSSYNFYQNIVNLLEFFWNISSAKSILTTNSISSTAHINISPSFALHLIQFINNNQLHELMHQSTVPEYKTRHEAIKKLRRMTYAFVPYVWIHFVVLQKNISSFVTLSFIFILVLPFSLFFRISLSAFARVASWARYFENALLTPLTSSPFHISLFVYDYPALIAGRTRTLPSHALF